MREILSANLNPTGIEIEDESHQHSGHRIETHFKVLVVSEVFDGLSRVARQRIINDLLKQEFETGLHALTQRTHTPAEFLLQGGPGEFVSPACLGVNKIKI
jgi:BolA protein